LVVFNLVCFCLEQAECVSSLNPVPLDNVDLNFPCSRHQQMVGVAGVDITSLIKPHPQLECDAGTWNSSQLMPFVIRLIQPILSFHHQSILLQIQRTETPL